jgi:hypothetical protein
MSCSSLSSCTERTQEGELGSGRMTPTREKAIYRRHPAELVMRNALASANLGGLSAIRKLAMPKLSPTFQASAAGS